MKQAKGSGQKPGLFFALRNSHKAMMGQGLYGLYGLYGQF